MPLLEAGMGLLGIGLNQMGNQNQMQQQQQLMNQQMQNQQMLNLQNQSIQQQNWDYTNYGNQVKHMENAGLNVGLMYGMGGGGGQSMGGGGGSAAGGNAPQNTTPQIMGSLLQAQQIASQVALNDAQAKKINAETTKISGVDTANVTADTALKGMTTKNAEVQNTIGNRSLEDVLDSIKANRDKAVAESSTAITGADVSATTKNSQIAKINAEAINEAFKLGVMKSGINLNEAQINNMAEQIKIGKFNANTNAEFQSLDRVAGNGLLELIAKIKSMFGMNESNIKKVE